MARTGGRARGGNGDVDGLGGEHPGLGLGLENALALGQGLAQAAAGDAEEPAGGRPVGLVERPDAATGAGQGGGVADEGQTGLLESRQVAGGGNSRQHSSRLIMHSPSLNGIGFAEMLVFNSELAKYLKVNTRRELLEPVFFDYLASPDLPSFIFYAETLRGYTLLED